MPITLPQLSRRAFLKRAALAGAAIAVVPHTYAGLFGKSRDKHTFAFFSDAHIAADAKTNHGGVNMADNLAACTRELAAWPVQPAAVIVNGDLAFAYGKSEDYGTFGELIHPLRAMAPIHLSLGKSRPRCPCKSFWEAFPADATPLATVPDKQATVFSGPRANWFLLDSLDMTAVTPGDIPERPSWTGNVAQATGGAPRKAGAGRLPYPSHRCHGASWVCGIRRRWWMCSCSISR